MFKIGKLIPIHAPRRTKTDLRKFGNWLQLGLYYLIDIVWSLLLSRRHPWCLFYNMANREGPDRTVLSLQAEPELRWSTNNESRFLCVAGMRNCLFLEILHLYTKVFSFKGSQKFPVSGRKDKDINIWAVPPLRNVSTQINLRSPRRLIQADTFRLRGIEV